LDRVVGLEGVRVGIAMMQTPGGDGRLELVSGDAIVAALRARGVELVGDLVRYEDSYRLCYVRGLERIIIELSERIG
jgi:hypothetical protein